MRNRDKLTSQKGPAQESKRMTGNWQGENERLKIILKSLKRMKSKERDYQEISKECSIQTRSKKINANGKIGAD